MVYVRKNVWGLAGPWAPELLWYARAVKIMKQRPLNDRLSWRFYGAIHGFNAARWQQVGQPAPPAQRPPTADQDTFWDQCQHGSWYFLPWHRGYLMAFERVVRAAMATLPNAPADWALPYWNYLKPGENRLPPEFASRAWPDGASDNPLFEEVRYGPNGDGDVFIELTGPYAVEQTTALGDKSYVGAADGGSAGFGGPETDAFSHSGSTHGDLESQPHDMTHVNIGGIQTPGLMSDPDTAGLDPIFWLHHANIDRLWEVWKGSADAQGDPPDANWRGGPASLGDRAFVMPVPDPSPGGSTWTYTPADVADLSVLDYTYDDMASPSGVAALTQRFESLGAKPADAAALLKKAIAMPRKVEALGASEVGLPLTGAEARARVVLKPEIRAKVVASLTAVPKSVPDRVFLNLENVRAARDGTVLNVYLNLPEGADPASHPELKAGSIALFGARSASERDGQHAGDGLTFSLEITRLVDRLHLSGALATGDLNVRLVPRTPVPADAKITIGRIGVYRQEG